MSHPKASRGSRRHYQTARLSIETDAFYTLLLGLDGAASIGDVQQMYQIRDEKGNPILDSGDLEVEAWEQFHGDDA